MLVAAVGAAVVAVDAADLVKALVVPRPQTSSPIGAMVVGLRRATHHLAASITDFDRRDRFLAVMGASLILVRLALWLGIGMVGFAFLMWGIGDLSISSAFVLSGSSVFTLGFATTHGSAPITAVFVAAAFGLVVIALQIAYLPALYDAFNRRETLVTMLESRAGSPAWGPELLARHHLVGIEANLPSLYADWERWAADVAESHTTYPTLLYLRSPHAKNSWIVALIAVMDSAALYMSLCPVVSTAEARLCVRMGFTAMRDMARAMRIDFDPDPLPDQPLSLTRQEFDEAVAWLERAHVPLERTADEAWPHFVGWRVNYESIAYTLASLVFAPPALWTGPRRGSQERILPARPVDRRPDSPQGAPRGPGEKMSSPTSLSAEAGRRRRSSD